MHRIFTFLTLTASLAAIGVVAWWAASLFPHTYQGHAVSGTGSPLVFCTVLVVGTVLLAVLWVTTPPSYEPSRIAILAARIWGRKRLLLGVVATLALSSVYLWTLHEKGNESSLPPSYAIGGQPLAASEQKRAAEGAAWDRAVDEYLACAERFSTTAEASKHCGKAEQSETHAPACKSGAASCEPWERDWHEGDIKPGSVVTEQGQMFKPKR
jgi:hypothetical protein